MPHKTGDKHELFNTAASLAAKQPAPLLGFERLLSDRDLEELTGRARSSWQKARLTGDGPRFI